MIKKYRFLFVCVLIFSTAANAQLQPTTIGDAIDQGNNCFTITPDQLNQAGGVWFDNPINFDQDFTIYYQNNFGNKDGNGADGMALVFKTSPTPEIGNVGGGMGYEGINNSMVVEFDTFQNDASVGNLGDPAFDHISIQRDGNPSHLNPTVSLTSAVPISNNSPNVEDGIDHEVKIVWETNIQAFSVFFDCEFVLGLTLDIKNDIFNGDDSVFFGFVGSTGGLSNLHQVCFNSISFVDELQLQDVAICDGDFTTINATIPSGSTYSWSPTTGVGSPNSAVTIISPPATETYTVTISDVCGDSTTEDITITVLDNVTPTFDPYPPYNIGDTIPDLPLVSNNGVTGTWSPEINNTQTTTYLFTPDPGQCASTQSLTIVVNSIDTDGDGIGDNIDIDDDNDGILDINESGFEEIASAVFDPALEQWQFSNITVQAGSTYQLIPTGFSLPQTTVSGGPYDGQTLQEVVILDSANDAWSDLDGNVYDVNNDYVGTFSALDIPFANLQASDYTTELTYIGMVDTNGNGNFDSSIDEIIEPIFKVNQIIAFTPNLSGDFYIVYTDSFYADNIGDLSFDTTLSSDNDTDNDGVFDRLDLDSDNDGIPDNVEAQSSLGYIAPSGISSGMTDADGDGLDDNYDQDTNSPATETSVGLIPVNTDISDEEDYINPDTDNDGFPDIEENGLANAISAPFADSDNDGIDDVFDVFDGFDVNNNIIDPTTDLPDCDGDVFDGGDMDYRELVNSPAFNLVDPICEGDTLEPLPTVSNNNISGSWSPALDNTQTTVYTFTPDDPSCGNEYLLEIIVNSQETPTFDDISTICSGDQLDELPTTSNNGISGTWSPAIDNTQTTVYTFTPNDGQCATTATLEIEVLPVDAPVFNVQQVYCSGENIEPLPTTSDNGVEGTWSPDIDNTQTTTYTFTPNTSECATSTTLEIEIEENSNPEFNAIQTEYCVGEEIEPLPALSDNGINGTWSPEIDNSVTTTYTFTPDPGQGCTLETTVTINIDQGTVPEFNIRNSICEGDIITGLTEISANGITGSWSPDPNNSETTTYTFTPNPGQCATQSFETTITVNPVNTISLNAVMISPVFEDNLSVQLEVTGGNGTYEFRVNSGPWQTSNIFTNLQNGTQLVFEARQINTCSNIASANFTGLSFPDFFTPNADGFNDYWNIRGLKDDPAAVIYIFDRYGKLLEQVNPIQIGWDGTYNGKLMPSQDYWFLVEFTDVMTGNIISYNNHFTLKR